jgi:hypothetical protein
LTVIATNDADLFCVIDAATARGIVTGERSELKSRSYVDDDLDFGDGPFAMLPFDFRDGWFIAMVDAVLKSAWAGLDTAQLEVRVRQELVAAAPSFDVKVGIDDDEVTVAARSRSDLIAAAHLLGLPGLEPETGEFDPT